MAKVLIKGQKEIEVDMETPGELTVNGSLFDYDLVKTKPNHYHVVKDHRTYNIEVLAADKATKNVSLLVNGKQVDLLIKDKMDVLLEKLGIANVAGKKVNELKAPMPGLIFDVLVKEGEEVELGTPLLILEAMKMENMLKSPGTGTIKGIAVKKGQSVEKNQVLITFS